jgi:hypothetical protein
MLSIQDREDDTREQKDILYTRENSIDYPGEIDLSRAWDRPAALWRDLFNFENVVRRDG